MNKPDFSKISDSFGEVSTELNRRNKPMFTRILMTHVQREKLSEYFGSPTYKNLCKEIGVKYQQVESFNGVQIESFPTLEAVAYASTEYSMDGETVVILKNDGSLQLVEPRGIFKFNKSCENRSYPGGTRSQAGNAATTSENQKW